MRGRPLRAAVTAATRASCATATRAQPVAVVTFAGDDARRAGLHERPRGHRPGARGQSSGSAGAPISSTPSARAIELIQRARRSSPARWCSSPTAATTAARPRATQATAAASAANVRIFTIGLRSRRRRLRHAEPAGGGDARRVLLRRLDQGPHPDLRPARLPARQPVRDPLPLRRRPARARRRRRRRPRRSPAARAPSTTSPALRPVAHAPFRRSPGSQLWRSSATRCTRDRASPRC